MVNCLKFMKKFHNLTAILIAVGIVILDRITKYLASEMQPGQSIPLIKNIVQLTLVHNTGGGFGILKGYRIFFVVFSIIVLFVMIYKWKKIPEKLNITVPLGLILGGTVGNLIDRIFQGYVIDFIDIGINSLRWPAFNAADSGITIGVVWLVIYLWKK